MKKFLFTMALLFSVLVSVSAQTAIEYPKFFDNTYVGATVGVSTPLSLDNLFPVNTNVGIRAGKKISPTFGIAVEGTGWFGSAATDGQRFSYKNFVRATNIGVIGTMDVFNLFKFRNDRVFNLEAVAGLGWLHRFNNGGIPDMNDLSAKTGVDIGLFLGNHKIFVEPAIYWNLTDGAQKIRFNSSHAQLALSVGYVYYFKTSNGTHNFKVYDIAALNEDINALRAENEELKSREPVKEIVEIPVETTVVNEVVKYVGNIGIVTFAQGKADLTEEAKQVLNNISGKVSIKAYASPEGGNKVNKKLSEKRAEVVKEYLEARGVEVVAAEGAGNTGATSQRIAIIVAD